MKWEQIFQKLTKILHPNLGEFLGKVCLVGEKYSKKKRTEPCFWMIHKESHISCVGSKEQRSFDGNSNDNNLERKKTPFWGS